MKKLIQRTALILGLLFTTMHVIAAPDVDTMTNMEVTEYAIRFSDLLQNIEQQNICQINDTHCLRNELQRYGIAYDDKETVQKRLVIMVGSVY